MLIRIDEASEKPIYAQIADSVRGDMLTGRIQVGVVLPPAREVATGLGANVHTVLRAYQLLRDEGLVDLKRRRGAVVTEAAAHLAHLNEDIDALVSRALGAGITADALSALVAVRAASLLNTDQFSAEQFSTDLLSTDQLSADQPTADQPRTEPTITQTISGTNEGSNHD